MNRWRIGEVTISQLVELTIEGELDRLIPSATKESMADDHWLQPDHVTSTGALRMGIHAFAIDTPRCRIVVDTCVGNGRDRILAPIFNQLATHFLESLSDAGAPPQTVDIVVCTHLHLDHVGWNTYRVDDRWVPTFPNARYLFGKTEFEKTLDLTEQSAGTPRGDFLAAVMGDAIMPVIDAGLVDLVETNHRICDEVSLIPTPGHTLGHVSVLIQSAGEEAIITGDAIHHPCQLAHPEWCTIADSDFPQTIETRLSLLERACAHPNPLMIGSHFAGPGAGKVVRDGSAYRLI